VSEPVRWGILSTALINDKFLAGAQAVAGAEIVAVASRDGERARSYAAQRRIPRTYGSYEALLADPEIEAVYIPLPNSLHVPWSIRALQAGKHVLCEKPLARRAADAERAFECARANGRLLSEAFMYRHHPQTRLVRELVDEGAVGELRLVRSHFSFHISRAGDVRLSAELEGGALMDVGCYCVSASRLLAGEPESVAAMQELSDAGVDMRFAATMRFAGGVLSHFDCGFDFASRGELEVVGSHGTIRVSDPWHCVEPVIELQRRDGVERLGVERLNPYALEAENFSAAVRGHGTLLLGAEDGIAQARAIEALYQAAQSGRESGQVGLSEG
jgi:predicted dehydrogenase